jgi:hypothetical protein
MERYCICSIYSQLSGFMTHKGVDLTPFVLPIQATVICIDNSEWMRNGDYAPTRFQAQADAVNLICGAKTQVQYFLLSFLFLSNFLRRSFLVNVAVECGQRKWSILID